MCLHCIMLFITFINCHLMKMKNNKIRIYNFKSPFEYSSKCKVPIWYSLCPTLSLRAEGNFWSILKKIFRLFIVYYCYFFFLHSLEEAEEPRLLSCSISFSFNWTILVSSLTLLLLESIFLNWLCQKGIKKNEKNTFLFANYKNNNYNDCQQTTNRYNDNNN